MTRRNRTRLDLLIYAAGLTRTDFAAALGVAQVTCRLWAMGAMKPRRDRWPAIAKILGLPIAEVIRQLGLGRVRRGRAVFKLGGTQGDLQ